MDIAGAILNRLHQQQIDEPDDRRIVGQMLELVDFDAVAVVISVQFNLFFERDDVLQAFINESLLAVGLIDHSQNVFFHADRFVDFQAGECTDGIFRIEVERVGGDEGQRMLILLFKWNERIAPRNLLGNERDEFALDPVFLRDFGEGKFEQGGKGLGQFAGGAQPALFGNALQRNLFTFMTHEDPLQLFHTQFLCRHHFLHAQFIFNREFF